MIKSEIGLKRDVKPGKKKQAPFWLTVFIVFLLILSASSYFSYDYVIRSHQNKVEEEEIQIDPQKSIAVEIPLGSNTASIAEILKKNGLIKHTFIFKVLSKVNGYDGMYKSGTHILSKELDYDKIMRVLSSNPVSVRVTLLEGYTYRQVSEALSKKKLIVKDKLDKVASEEQYDFDFLKGIPKRDIRLEGYLFPDTYEFDMKAGEKEILTRLLSRFNEIFRPEYYEKAKKLGMTVDQIITLASIIEKEAQDPDERATIAGVFYNRLKQNDKSLKKLQSCATIQYIYFNRMKDVSEEDKNRVAKGIISNSDTNIDDPYNTYKFEGLPPGPICNPGKASIEAALNPEKIDYLYFVAKGDGTHIFSKTLKEHENAKKSIYGQ